MPEFGTPFAVLKNDRKLTDDELIRAVRFMISAEYEAIQLYEQLAESTDNKLAVEVLHDIADEEKVHAGEFLKLLHCLAPDEQKFYDEGYKEVAEEIEKIMPGKAAKPATAAKPAKPVTAAKPAKAAKPAQPAKPAKAAKPVKTAQPAKSEKPAKAAKAAKAEKAPKKK